TGAANKFRAWLVDYNCGGSSSSNTTTGCTTMSNRNLTVKLYGSTGLQRTYAYGQGTSGSLSNGYWELFSMTGTGARTNLNKTSSTLPDNVD
ncbi:MAG TPA: hypothetical protein VL283_04600, partial [Candidatus Baltobacteraceae bacterium]|nr:hypothetical protein [Candidatus Baltobacteraceae bacterium]